MQFRPSRKFSRWSVWRLGYEPGVQTDPQHPPDNPSRPIRSTRRFSSAVCRGRRPTNPYVPCSSSMERSPRWGAGQWLTDRVESADMWFFFCSSCFETPSNVQYLGWRRHVWAHGSAAWGSSATSAKRGNSPWSENSVLHEPVYLHASRRLTSSEVLRKLGVLYKVFPSHHTVQALEIRYARRVTAPINVARQPMFFFSSMSRWGTGSFSLPEPSTSAAS